MATPGELIKTTASVLGLSEATATTYYRSLREAGLVTKGGRGPSAPNMTARDAAQLLIAAGGSRFEKDTAEKIVRDFDRVQSFEDAHRLFTPDPANPKGQMILPHGQILGDGAWVLDDFSIPQLQALPARHSFGDALTATIEAAMANAFAAACGADGSHSITVYVHGPEPHAGIEIDLAGDKFIYKEEVGYQLVDQIDKRPANYVEVEEHIRRAYGDGDLEIIRKFTHRTIYAIARLMLGLEPT